MGKWPRIIMHGQEYETVQRQDGRLKVVMQPAEAEIVEMDTLKVFYEETEQTRFYSAEEYISADLTTTDEEEYAYVIKQL